MKGMGRKLGILLLALAVLALSSGAALADGWTFTDLSSMGAIDATKDSNASKINYNGDILGTAFYAGADYRHATLWRDGASYDLGTLGAESLAAGINDAGVMVGRSYIITSPGGTHAAIYSTGDAPEDIHPADIDYSRNTHSGIGDINNDGKMAGYVYSDLYVGGYRPVRWNDPATYDILEAGELGTGIAQRINSLGQMTGWVSVITGYEGIVPTYAAGAAFWDAEGSLTELGSFDGKYSFAHGLNDLGQVVVSVNDGDPEERWSYVWQDGEIGDRLAGLGGDWVNASAINNSGLIVGEASTADGEKYAVLWQDGEIFDLNDLISGTGLVLTSANDINEQGQIVGYAHKEDGTHVAFLLSPDLTPTPVPASVLLFGSGLAGLALFRRRTQG